MTIDDTEKDVSKLAVGVRKQPEHMLSNLRVQEVALVPFGANARQFAVVKSADGDPSMKLRLPAQAQKTALAAVMDLTEKLSALTSQLSNAEADDAAPVPAEIGKSLRAIGQTVDGLAKQYGGYTAEEEDEKKKKKDEMEKAAALATIEKAGRAISGDRVQRLKALHDQITAAQKALGDMLAEVEPSASPADAATKTLAQQSGAAAPVDVAAVAKAAGEAAASALESKLGDMVSKAVAAAQPHGAPTRVLEAPLSNAGGGGGQNGSPPIKFHYNLADYAKENG